MYYGSSCWMIVAAVGFSCKFMQTHRLAVLNVELWLHIVFQTVSCFPSRNVMLSWPLRRELDTAITKPPTIPPLPLPSTPTWRTPPWSLSPGCSPGGTRASWKGFPTKHGVMIHQRSCGAFECFVCEVSFTSAKELKYHMKSLHKNV